ncbi:MAG: HlyD family efflux transporter periplasmic adaptor subunit [Candidatus Omnitrophica bacterium]|nr:HlyD family efflux transporter periplasmic adaptor subunit [Candidatus Omnitrophota bacterium]
MVDIPKEPSRGKNFIIRLLIAVVVLTLVIAAGIAYNRLEPAAPTIEKSSVFIDTVVRGDMVRKVRGSGRLVPIDIRWVTPATNGRVERTLLEPGATVDPDTILLELSNPELELAVEEANLNFKSSESELEAKKVEFDKELLDLETSAARIEADLAEAKLRAESDKELAKDGLISELQLEVSTVRAEELAKLREIEERRVGIQKQYSDNLQRVLAAQVDQASALYNLKQHQLDALKVRAGFKGVLEQLMVEEGQQVDVTTDLAKISDPDRLKAVVRIDQNQVREVSIGLPVEIDLRNSVLKGRVSRIDPSVQEGTVNVDVTLEDPLPPGARSDQTLSGEIEIETIPDSLYVGRPVYGQPGATVSLFKLNSEGMEATRVSVELGRGSAKTIEVVNGLAEGDRIILSDMNEWDKVDRVRLR